MGKIKLYGVILLCFVAAHSVNGILRTAVQGTKCNRNQGVYKLTVYEDGAIEAECGPIPCGESGIQCLHDQTSCKAESDVFSGMKWAKNGQSLILRCCSLSVANKIYVGTDLVTYGSYYTGGLVAKKDMYGQTGAEYDFVANIRTEQGGARIWVYRMMCSSDAQKPENSNESQQQQQKESYSPQQQEPKASTMEERQNYLMAQLDDKQVSEPAANQTADKDTHSNSNAESNDSPADSQNPLQYRPPRRAVSRS